MSRFNKELPEWLAVGVKPPESSRTEGWKASQKPPADWFNWYFNTTYQALKEIQETAALHADLNTHVNNKANPHGVTKTQIGLGNVDDIKQAPKASFDAHVANQNNPHGVTKAQLGLSDVTNIEQASKVEFNAHKSSIDNPHKVTKAQVGLNAVNNFGLATTNEARSGISNTAYMTPFSTKQAIDTIAQVIANKALADANAAALLKIGGEASGTISSTADVAYTMKYGKIRHYIGALPEGTTIKVQFKNSDGVWNKVLNVTVGSGVATGDNEYFIDPVAKTDSYITGQARMDVTSIKAEISGVTTYSAISEFNHLKLARNFWDTEMQLNRTLRITNTDLGQLENVDIQTKNLTQNGSKLLNTSLTFINDLDLATEAGRNYSIAANASNAPIDLGANTIGITHVYARTSTSFIQQFKSFTGRLFQRYFTGNPAAPYVNSDTTDSIGWVELATAKNVDDKFAESLELAKKDAEEKASQALSDANSYTDKNIETALATASDDATAKADNAIVAAAEDAAQKYEPKISKTGWQDPNLNSGFSIQDATYPPQYKKVGNEVRMTGGIKRPSALGVMFILPTECRPKKRKGFSVSQISEVAGNVATVYVFPNGEVKLMAVQSNNDAGVWLDNIRFDID